MVHSLLLICCVFLFQEEVTKYAGLTCERYETITEDGYILTLHRLPPQKPQNIFYGVPILLQHGLWSSSEDWVAPGPMKSIGLYMLGFRLYCLNFFL